MLTSEVHSSDIKQLPKKKKAMAEALGAKSAFFKETPTNFSC